MMNPLHADSIKVCPYCSEEVKVAFDTGFRAVEVCGCEHQHELEPMKPQHELK